MTKIVALSDVCDLVGGGTPSKSKSSYYAGDIPWATVRDMKVDIISDTEFCITEEAVKASSTNVIPGGNVVIATRVGLGKVCLLGQDTAINQDLRGLLPKHPGSVLPKYLFYWYSTIAPQVVSAGTGATVQGVKVDFVKSLQLPLRSLSKQKRIVAILDEASAGIALAQTNAEKNLQNARTLFENHLQTVLKSEKWEWRTLGELCDSVEYGSSSKSKKEGKYPVLRMGNIQGGKLDWESLVYTNDQEEFEKYQLKHNDVLFNRTNSPELVGKTAIYKGEMPAIFAGYLIRIHRREDLLDADYLCYFLNSRIAFDYGKTVVSSSVNQANINGSKLKSYPMPVPSLGEQKNIVAELNSMAAETKRLETIYQKKITELTALKKALLHQAFSGEL